MYRHKLTDFLTIEQKNTYQFVAGIFLVTSIKLVNELNLG
jgi:hypothetical protein